MNKSQHVVMCVTIGVLVAILAFPPQYGLHCSGRAPSWTVEVGGHSFIGNAPAKVVRRFTRGGRHIYTIANAIDIPRLSVECLIVLILGAGAFVSAGWGKC